MRQAPVVVCLLLVLAHASTAEAGVPKVMKLGTREMWVSAGIGAALGFGDTISQTKLNQTLGVHFLGRTEGPALALELQESVGYDVFIFEVMPRFFWDIAVVDRVAFYITPSVGVGFAYIDDDRRPSTGAATQITETEGKGLTIQVAVEARLVINDRGLVFLRPLAVDIISAEYTLSNATTRWDTRVRWDLMFGGGVTF
jgi:hypothetical protein